MVGSLDCTGLLLALLAVGIERVAGIGIPLCGRCRLLVGDWRKRISLASTCGRNIIGGALTGSPLVMLIIGLGYMLNRFQIVRNCYIGMTRVLVAMSLDRLLPEWFSKVDEKRHTPVNAHLAYFLASIPVIFLQPAPETGLALTLGVTFGCGYVFVVTCLAGAFLPYRAKDVVRVLARREIQTWQHSA